MNEQQHVKQLESQLTELKHQNQQLQQRLTQPASAGAPQAARDRRLFWSRLLVTLSLLTLIPAGMLVWLHRTVMDPASYLKTVGPVIQQPAVQQSITAHATAALFSSVDVERAVAERLPAEAGFLAPPIAAQVKTQTTNVVANIVASQKFYEVWLRANQAAQAAFVKVATSGRTSPTINISDVYGYLSDQLQDTRLAPLLNRQLPPRVGTIQVADVPALANIPHLVAVLDAWRYWLVILSLALITASVWVARDRRRALIRLGELLVLAALFSLILVRLARSQLLAQVHDPVDQAAVTAVWQTLLQAYYLQLAVVTVLGFAVIAASWLAGPGRIASRLRQDTAGRLASGRTRLLPQLTGNSAVSYLQQHRRYFEWGLLGVTALALVFFMPLTLVSTLSILLIAAVVLLAVEFFAYPLAGQKG